MSDDLLSRPNEESAPDVWLGPNAKPPQPAFDYSELATEVADRQRERATRIAGIYRSTVEAAGRIGSELLAAQEDLGHGLFLRWVEGPLGLSKSSAYRFMDVARSFGDKLPTVGSLPMTVVHKLAAPATPAPVREQVIQRLEAGEDLPPAEITRLVEDARQAVREAEKKAKITPEEKAKRERAEKRRQRELAKYREEQDQAVAERRAISEEIAAIIVRRVTEEEARRLYDIFPQLNPYLMREAISRARIALQAGAEAAERDAQDDD